MSRKKPTQMADVQPSETRGFIPPPTYSQSRQLEGQCRIESYQPLRLWAIGAFLLLPLLTLLTCFIGLILVLRSTRLKAWFLYRKCPMNEATHFLVTGSDRSRQIVPLEESHPTQILYQKVKYSLSRTHSVVSYHYPTSRAFSQPRYWQVGLTREEVLENRWLYGLCQHRVDIPTLFEYLLSEMTGPLFLLQYFNCIIYVSEGFYFFSAMVIGFSILTTIINYFLLRSSLKNIKQIAERVTQVHVVRNGAEQVIASDQVVPGDVLLLKEGTSLLCDCIVLTGELFLNEASLTGESVPIQKLPPAGAHEYNNDKCWLYEGSTIVEVRGTPAALVVHTGFITRKGRIIRKILHRTEPRPQFYRHGFYFLLELLLYGSLLYFATLPMMIGSKIVSKLIVLRFFDMVGWVIPPTFPIYFNLCYSFALYRLRRQQIFGTQPTKTITAGKVRTICFDKTGTLTENRANLHLIVRANGQTSMAWDFKQKSESDPVLRLFGCCHTVRRINGEFLGDELDLRMFEFSGFDYCKPSNQTVKLEVRKDRTVLEVLRINQFESKFQSMSVLVKDCATNEYFVMVKGAPQKMKDISQDRAASFIGYDETISRLSLAGLRSLAFGVKKVPPSQQLLTIDRSEFERGILIIGLVGFENKLKPDTRDTILLLNSAQVDTKIITGDNIYIAVETAVRAGFVASSSKVLVLQGQQQVVRSDAYSGQLLDLASGLVSSTLVRMSLPQIIDSKFAVAIDNRFLLENEAMVPYVRIFARISPENKARIVLLHQQRIREEFNAKPFRAKLFGEACSKIAMVGDGANDILAIRQSDVGIGMSETDSSFAASFSVSKVMDVEAVMRSGRSTMAIIREIFQYYVAVSCLKYTASVILAMDRSGYSDGQWTAINYMSTLEIVVLLCLSGPAKQLSRYLPNDNFMSWQSHLATLGQIIISSAGVLTVYLVAQANPSFHENSKDIEYDIWVFKCHSNTVVFLSSQIFYIMMAVWLYTSQPWKARIWTNIPLSIWLLLVLATNIAFFWLTPHLSKFFSLVDVGFLAWVTFGLTMAFVALGGIWASILNIVFRKKQ